MKQNKLATDKKLVNQKSGSKESSPMKLEQGYVVSASGSIERRDACRLIGTLHYKIGDIKVKDSGDCYLLNGTYYKVLSGKIEWDYENQQYTLKEELSYGLVDKGRTGWFRARLDKLVRVVGDREVICAISAEVAEQSGLVYDFSTGSYGRKEYISSNGFMRLQQKSGGDKPAYNTLPNSVYSMSDFDSDVLARIEAHQIANSAPASRFDSLLFGYNFGLEIETDLGFLPEYIYYKYGAVPLKDGSIKGTEITTLLMKGTGLFWNMIHLFQACNKYTEATQNNSLHVNVSGFENTPLFRVALYNLYFRLERDIVAFIPSYKRRFEYIASKPGEKKDHCKLLEPLNIVKRYTTSALAEEVKIADEMLFKFLNEGHGPNSDFNLDNRRHVKQGAEKWTMVQRYYSLNFMPLYFGHKKHARVEFRYHSGTVNPIKSIVWCMICAAIVRYTELHAERILISREKIDLEDVLREVIGTESEENAWVLDYIIQYIQERRAVNTNLAVIGSTDIYGQEFSQDPKYRFALKGMDIIQFAGKCEEKAITSKGA